MDQRLETIQQDYIAELRAAMPAVRKWWKAGIRADEKKKHPAGISVDFERRWPAGMVGHPRILAIFRKYFIATEIVNAELESEYRKRGDEEESGEGVNDEAMWGIDSGPLEREHVLPIELLVEDLEDDAPDLFEVMQDLAFVPVGEDDDDEESG